MKGGAIFPQTEIGADLGAIRSFVRGVEALGYDHSFVADHVLVADPRVHTHPSLERYSYKSVVHEPLRLMAYMAAITSRLVLATGILLLPQRQTAPVAKQGAELDVLSGGCSPADWVRLSDLGARGAVCCRGREGSTGYAAMIPVRRGRGRPRSTEFR